MKPPPPEDLHYLMVKATSRTSTDLFSRHFLSTLRPYCIDIEFIVVHLSVLLSQKVANPLKSY